MISSPAANTHSFVPNRYLVGLKSKVQNSDELSFLQESGFRHLETFQFPEKVFPDFGGDVILVEGEPTLAANEALLRLSASDAVEYAEPDLELELDTTKRPNDLSSSLWGLHNSAGVDIDAPEAWNKTTGSRDNGPVIAVLDTGIDLTHPDLQANLWTNSKEIPGNGIDDDGNGVVDDVHGYNAHAQTGDPSDLDGHGTHCAGTIGAVGNNDRGVVGVNWETRIMPIKIFNDEKKPRASTSAILRGVSYASRNGARLTSNSYGGSGYSRSVERAFANSPAFHLFAAGNDSKNNDESSYYPANYHVKNSLAVASIDRRGALSDFSNYGKETVDVAAPGTSIQSTIPGGRYGGKSGTSMATPHVTGIAGLALTLNPGLSNPQLKEVLVGGVVVDDGLKDKVATSGRVNASQTLGLVEQISQAPSYAGAF